MGSLVASERGIRGGFSRRRGLAGKKLYAVIAVAIGALLIVPGIVVYQGSGGGNVATKSSSSQSSTISLGQQQVGSRIQEYTLDISNLNATSMDILYTSSAVLTWYGKGINSSAPFNRAGTYGKGNLSALYSSLFNELVPSGGLSHPLAYSNILTEAIPSQISTVSVSSSVVNATFRLYLNFSSGLFGDVGATVSVKQQWTSQNGNGGSAGWYISRDSWNFASSQIQFPIG
jgi:hypothetical protein